jgi:hypothetical protein
MSRRRTGQKRADAIFTPNPIFPVAWSQRVRRISIDPLGPFGRVEIVSLISPRNQLPNHRRFPGPGHTGDQHALHVFLIARQGQLSLEGRVPPKAVVQTETLPASGHPARQRPNANYRMAFAASTSRALVVAVASKVPSPAISLPSTNATVLPSCITVASPVIGPGLAGARKLTVMLMVAV